MAGLKYWIWLTSLRGVNNQTCLALLERFRTPEDIFYADAGDLQRVEGLDREQIAMLSNRSLENADRILGECQRLNIHVLTIQDALYPGRLRDIFNPPCVLYVKGRLPVIEEEAVISAVGTRSCTPYGIKCAERISFGLASGGAVVASGLARGIDSAASRGALMAGGVTLGLLGNGLDVVYPRENKGLYEDVAASGALISEYPPGTEPLPGNFPQRNRILSGISVGALIVEAPLRSGALITASLALDQGRDVYAVPGPVDAYASRGCNRLIQDGAALVADARDILEVYMSRFPEKIHDKTREPSVIAGESNAKPSNPSEGADTPSEGADTPSEGADTPSEGADTPSEGADTPSGERKNTPSGERGGARSEDSAARSGDSSAHNTTRSGEHTASEENSALSGGVSGENPSGPVRELDPAQSGLSEEQLTLLRLMDTDTPLFTDDLIELSGIPTRQVLAALTLLEIDGLIRQHSGKRYTRLVRLLDPEHTDASGTE